MQRNPYPSQTSLHFCNKQLFNGLVPRQCDEWLQCRRWHIAIGRHAGRQRVAG